MNDMENSLSDSILNIQQQIETLSSQMSPILDEFKRLFVNSEVHHDDPEQEQQLEQSKTHLQNINSNIFSLSNKIDVIGENVEDEMMELNKEIEELKKKNVFLKRKAGILESEYNGAGDMIEEYKWKYNVSYTRNVLLLIGILIILFILKILFMSS
jgi:cell division protein FtsB